MVLHREGGAERGMFAPIELDKVFRGVDGLPVLIGGMGVDKTKLIDGKLVECLRCT